MGLGDEVFAGFCQISVASAGDGLRLKVVDEAEGAAAPWRAWNLTWVVEDIFEE